MCTVSFVATGNAFILTSNRDEAVSRPALSPEWYTVGEKKLLFPKDPKAGGTWFATDKSGNTIVLLNGARKKHKHADNYRLSRGLIVTDMLSHNKAEDYWQEIDLDKVEPFTIILLSGEKLYQLIWNGIEKETEELDTNQKYIWSSSTLYTDDVRTVKEQKFKEYLTAGAAVDADSLIKFHNTRGDEENGFIINRDNFLKTLSITQVVIDEHKTTMRYYDLSYSSEFIETFAR